jgi:3-oxoacyl-[acyl-carrier-protein] synthase II
MSNRTVITGMGIICPLGHDVETFWEAVLAGSTATSATTIFDASEYPTKFSAEVRDFDLSKHVENTAPHGNANRGSAFVVAAAAQACRQAGINIETGRPSDGIDRRRLGIYLGAGEGSVDNTAFFNSIIEGWDAAAGRMDWTKWAAAAGRLMKARHELEQEANMPAAHVALLTGARGPVRSCLTACAASTQAAGEAMMIIRRGDADVVVTGGAHSMIHPLGVMGFNRLTALSTRNESPMTASRPFSKSRDGFVIGEGAAVLVLESLESASGRGAPIVGEIVGYGSSSDAFRVTDMHEAGRGAVQAIQSALADAGLTADDVDYINTHGTGTAENDAVETRAIKAVFGHRAKNVPASSIKSMLGHLIGAAGAAELITCVLAIRDNIVPPTINLADPDPELDLDYVPNEARNMPVNVAINESFGFGGQNNVVVVKRFKR